MKYLLQLILSLCYTVVMSAPVILSFSPQCAAPGATVTIIGYNFNDTAANNIVSFGNVKGIVIASSSFSFIKVIVPYCASNAPISVCVGGAISISSQNFLPTYAGNTPLISASSFASPVSISLITINPNNPKLADMDGDGKLDIVTTKFSSVYGSDSILIFRNIHVPGSVFSTSSIAPAYRRTAGLAAGELWVKELNGDGKPDIVMFVQAAPSSWGFNFFYNTSTPGNFSFTTGALLTGTYKPTSFDMGDIDGDGRMDLLYFVTSIPGYRKIIARTGTATGFGSPSVIRTFAAPYNLNSKALTIEDINNDNKPDIFFSLYDSDTVMIYENAIAYPGSIDSANFANNVIIRTARFGARNFFADFDGDLQKDWFLFNQRSTLPFTTRLTINRTVYGYSPISPYNFDPPFSDTSSFPNMFYDVAVADLNGDAKPDIAATIADNGTLYTVRGMRVATNTITLPGSLGSSPFSGADIIPVTTTNQPYGEIMIGDINLDRKPDIIYVERITANNFVLDIKINNTPDTKPTIQASGVTVSALTNNNAHVSWTNGNGAGRIVLAKAINTITDTPTSYASYTAYSAFGTGTMVAPGTYVVYCGTGNNVNVSMLSPNTLYRFSVFEYKGHPAALNFLTTSSGSGSGTTLPVQWLSFTGESIGNDVQLKWQTASETNNDHFEMERSVGGNEWKFIASKKGNGNKASVSNYEYIDESAFEQLKTKTIYYRLKQVDFDGRHKYSSMISVNGISAEETNLSVIPNPSEGAFTILINNVIQGAYTVYISNMLGEIVFKGEIKNNNKLVNIEHLSPGVYFVQAFNDEEKLTQRIIVK